MAGDYMARFDGVLGKTTVERKSLADCFSSFSGDNYRREKEKWTRAKDNGLEYIIAIEASILEMRKGHTYRKHGEYVQCKKDGLSQILQLMTISQRYKIPVMYFENREAMAFWIQLYLTTPGRVEL